MLPALHIRQDHVVPSLRTDWTGVSAELLNTTDGRAYDFRFNGPALYLCFGLSGRRKDSVVNVDGEKATRFIEIANHFHIIPAGARFEGFSVPATAQRFVQIYLDPRSGVLHPDLDLTEIAPRLAATDANLMATARKFEAAVTAPRPLGRLYGETLGCALAIELLQWQRGQQVRQRATRGGLSPHQYNRVTGFIRSHLHEEIGLVQLARLADLTPWHFCRAFKQSTGMTPHRWVTALRIERAKELLADQRFSITDVALAVGFAGSTQFARSFRIGTGLSPTAWRQQRL
ncbi:helix-turn-helix domain-containing protein [Niveispirillum sp.]|uniref:helix-turn-helix domain-containing protein n=1 Tax=Niveispirillum sp. TaxID=1917217 RepID=UPI001B742395|nr:AraC family transcriptional regulator [Niveispirillum sp.]MBP7334259.1 helix-turn-helix transcriptional regulator [Niveispirillum sp.]